MSSTRSYSLGIALVALGLAGCETPYQPRGWNGGYTDFEAQPGVHYVSVEASRGTGYPTARRYWHRRAAEVCGGADRYTRIWTFDRPDALAAPTESQMPGAGAPVAPDSAEPAHSEASGLLLVEGYIVCAEPLD